MSLYIIYSHKELPYDAKSLITSYNGVKEWGNKLSMVLRLIAIRNAGRKFYWSFLWACKHVSFGCFVLLHITRRLIKIFTVNTQKCCYSKLVLSLATVLFFLICSITGKPMTYVLEKHEAQRNIKQDCQPNYSKSTPCFPNLLSIHFVY